MSGKNLKVQFKERLILEFGSFGYVYKIISDNGQIITLKGEEGAATVASLIDKYEWERIDMLTSLQRDDFSWLPEGENVPEESKYDYRLDATIQILLKKERRVKSYYDIQPLPRNLIRFLPREVKKELEITKKQIWFIDELLTDVDDFVITDKDISKLTKQEASALIRLLTTLKDAKSEPEPMPF